MTLSYHNLWGSAKNIPLFDMIISTYGIEISGDVIVYSCRNKTNLIRYTGPEYKIFYTGEPKLQHVDADCVVGFLSTGGKFIQMRNYERIVLERKGLNYPLYQKLNDKWSYVPKTKFCCFIVSNPKCWQRNKMFELLSQYKQVDSLGQCKNNCDILTGVSRGSEKYYEILSQYKFAIVFENTSKLHYMTEKLYNCFLTQTIPIYWGNMSVGSVFNPKSFVWVRTFRNKNAQITAMHRAVRRISNLDVNDKKYMNLYNQPCCIDPIKEDSRLRQSVQLIRDCISQV